ncbi:tRNA lysidine(34) synthetase TilS [Anthocerotibacter panamensis]|uniref:tRNA lysidine(34) synthetase TilS n=1 Tax=Anthocerotibacter panamensis TaxID=2857077 RepID=UPI001C40216E|nr:tRNA lysidine(34) synthetase TilS [Anthocerotibacter panamensis]
MKHSIRFTALHARVLADLQRQFLLTESQTVVMAVSGGQDSLCMGQILVDLTDRGGWHLVVAHLDHRWRTDSEQDSRVVEALAQQWGLPFYLKVADTAPPNEAVARDWRYAWLAALACTLGAKSVVTAHTASDRAETLLFNLMRGAGLSGCAILDWERPLGEGVQLVRPLLGVTRVQTGAFCQQRGLPVCVDSTNQDLAHPRNRIRLELLPYLEQHFNPQASRHLAQTADLSIAEDEYLTQLADEHFTELFCSAPPALALKPLRALPLALQRRVLHRFISEQGRTRATFAQVEEARTLLERPSGERTSSLAGGQGVSVHKEWLVWV